MLDFILISLCGVHHSKPTYPTFIHVLEIFKFNNYQYFKFYLCKCFLSINYKSIIKILDKQNIK